MRYLDRALQRARIKRAIGRLSDSSNILDIGCHQGELASAMPASCSYVGIDPAADVTNDQLVRGSFPQDAERVWQPGTFDHAVALAVLEHVPRSELVTFFSATRRLLKPGGTLVATVPSPRTDRILEVLERLRLIDGMDLDAHDGVTIEHLRSAATDAGLEITEHSTFQFGLNNVLVWRRPDDA